MKTRKSTGADLQVVDYLSNVATGKESMMGGGDRQSVV